MKRYFPFLVLFSTFQVFSQDAIPKVTTVQPKIMVVPFVKEGEDRRKILEGDDNKIIALTTIRAAFDKRNFTTVDFLAKYKSEMQRSMVSMSQGNQKDIMSTVISSSGADIYVEAKVDYLASSNGNSVTVVLTAFEISTGNSLSNIVGRSGKFYTDQIDRLTQKAVDECIEQFLNTMQEKFTQIVNDGRSIIVEINLSKDSKITFDTPYKGLPLSDVLEQWFEKNSYKNNYHIQGVYELQMVLDDVKIPLKDPQSGLNYNPSKFSSALLMYLQELGITAKRSQNGGTLLFTIQ
jgi:hypothetical protein